MIKQYKKRYWNQDELEFIKENYKKLSLERLSVTLNRSKDSIAKRLGRLGLKQREWTSQDLDFLRKNYKEMTIIELTKEINHPKDSIAHKLCELKLKKSKEDLGKIQKRISKKYYSGEEHYAWNGGRTKNHYGYIRIMAKSHPKSTNGYILEHRLVAEKVLGRMLNDSEVIHHINMKRDDNLPENLMLFPNEEAHHKFHINLRQFGLTNPRAREIEERKIINIASIKNENIK